MNPSDAIIETIAIGDELLTGKISDTNSTYVANEFFKIGFRLERQSVIADDVPTIKSSVLDASKRATLVVCFGGLGPTSDDKTAGAIAELLKSELIEHQESKEQLVRFVESRKRVLTPQILKQIVYPKGTKPLMNNCGLAVGFSFQLGKSLFFFLPGVPSEMKVMFKDHVAPASKQLLETSEKIFSHVWRCLELPESELQRLMDPVEKNLPQNAWLGYRTQYPENHLTFYYKSFQMDETFKKVSHTISEILSPYAYSENSKTIEEKVSELLRAQGKTVAFVESCTGGIACHRMTQVPGASEVVKGGLVTYTRELKNSVLGLDLKSEVDTVSRECTLALASQGKKMLKADYVAAVTGYLGPTGGTTKDPIGTIYIGVQGKKYLEKRIFQPWRDRTQAQWGAASHLLNLLRTALKEEK